MEKTLELIFTKSDGAKKTLSIADPREGLTLAEDCQGISSQPISVE